MVGESNVHTSRIFGGSIFGNNFHLALLPIAGQKEIAVIRLWLILPIVGAAALWVLLCWPSFTTDRKKQKAEALQQKIWQRKAALNYADQQFKKAQGALDQPRTTMWHKRKTKLENKLKELREAKRQYD